MLGMLITSRKKATLWFSFDQSYATRAGSRNLLAQKPPMLGKGSLISVIWQNLTCVKSSLSCLPPLSSQILEFRGKEKHRREEERYKKRGRDGDQKKKKKHRAGVPVM